MAIRILIVTSTPGFGDFIKQAINETGHYVGRLVTSSGLALDYLKSNQPELAILDYDSGDSGIISLGKIFRQEYPDLKLVVIPTENLENGDHTDGIVPDGYLTKPFYLPNLIKKLDSIFGKSTPIDGDDIAGQGLSHSSSKRSGRVNIIRPAPQWMEDVNRAAQHLTRLSLESAAHAALITKGNELWAYAGQLPQLAASELASSVSNYWNHDGGSDLALFLRLESTASDYMLYATALGGEYVLALAFETLTPFSEIRAQASKLASGLIKLPVESENQKFAFLQNKSRLQPGSKYDHKNDNFKLPDDAIPLPGENNAWDNTESLGLPDDWNTEPEKIAEDNIPSDSTVDTPDQGNINQLDEFLSDIKFGSDNGAGQELEMSESDLEDIFLPPTSEPSDLLKALNQSDHAEKIVDKNLDKDVHSSAVPSLEFTPSDLSSSEIKRKTSIERIWSSENLGLNNLTYACLFVPRMPSHKLKGDILSELTSWISNLCIAYNYRLKYIELNREFLLWIVNIDASKSPGGMLQNIAIQTSKRIFEEYPKFSRDNPSGEFWADDMFLINREQSFSNKDLELKISKIRKRQGINPQDWR